MPWALFGDLPVISIALPVRFMLYALLVISLIVAIWFARVVRSSTKTK